MRFLHLQNEAEAGCRSYKVLSESARVRDFTPPLVDSAHVGFPSRQLFWRSLPSSSVSIFPPPCSHFCAFTTSSVDRHLQRSARLIPQTAFTFSALSKSTCVLPPRACLRRTRETCSTSCWSHVAGPRGPRLKVASPRAISGSLRGVALRSGWCSRLTDGRGSPSAPPHVCRQPQTSFLWGRRVFHWRVLDDSRARRSPSHTRIPARMRNISRLLTNQIRD